MNTYKIFGTKVHEKPEFSKNRLKYFMGKSLPHPPPPLRKRGGVNAPKQQKVKARVIPLLWREVGGEVEREHQRVRNILFMNIVFRSSKDLIRSPKIFARSSKFSCKTKIYAVFLFG